MAKMAELHAEGITNLYDYQKGQENKLEEIKALVRKVIENPDIEMLPSRIVLQVLLATLTEHDDE